jgi:hypothetical protein
MPEPSEPQNGEQPDHSGPAGDPQEPGTASEEAAAAFRLMSPPEVVTGELVGAPPGEEPEPPPLPRYFGDRRKAAFSEPITVQQVEAYLGFLAETGTIKHAANLSGLGYNTVLRLRKVDDDFKAMHEEALEDYRDTLVRECHRRAVEGWEEPVFSQRMGTEIGTVRKYDSRLLELMLKRHIPEFRDKFEGEIKVSGGVLVAPVAASSVEEWKARHANARIELLSPESGGTLPPGPTDPGGSNGQKVLPSQ